MKTKSILFTIFCIVILTSHFVRMHMKKDEQSVSPKETEVVTEAAKAPEVAEPPAPKVLADSADRQQAPAQDTVYTPAISYKKVGKRIWTASDLGVLIRRDYGDHWDTLGVRSGDKVLYSWLDAIKACPRGFRLPRKEEFSSRDADDLGVGTWWTSNIVNMYTTQKRSKDSEYPETTDHILVAIADVDENSGMLSISETNYQEKHSVLCISDMSDNFEQAIYDKPPKISHKSGTITSVNFTPHYDSESSGCADCCCGEGDGGMLKINLDTDRDSLDKIIIYNYNSGFYCSLQPPEESEESEEGSPAPSNEQADDEALECIKDPKITDVNFFALFQKGAKVKSKHCEQAYFVISDLGGPYISTFPCGDTITVSFTGTIKDVQRQESEEGASCTYKIFNPATNYTATTTYGCKNVQVGSTYKVKVTVTYKENKSGVYYTMYPCCTGREDFGDDEFSLDFEPAE